MWGKSPRRVVATSHGYGTGACKTKYIGTRGLPAPAEG